jgi:hypothetical protein
MSRIGESAMKKQASSNENGKTKSSPADKKTLEQNIRDYAEDVGRANADYEDYLRNSSSKGGWVFL